MKRMLLLACLLFSVTVHAEDRVFFIGWGPWPCSTWSMSARVNEARQSIAVWVFGYLYGRAGNTERMKTADTMKIISFMNDYCAENPEDSIYTASNAALKAIATGKLADHPPQRLSTR